MEIKDYIYVSDVCEAFYKCAISVYKNEMLIERKTKKINELVKILKSKIINIHDTTNHNSKSKKNKIYLKWKPKVSFSRC